MPLSVWRDRCGIERIARAVAPASAGSCGGPEHNRKTPSPTGGTLLASSIDALSAGRDKRSEEFPFHNEQWFGRDTFAGGADKVSRFVVCAAQPLSSRERHGPGTGNKYS